MRILNIMLARALGGVETMALRYHEALRQTGYEVISIGHPDGVLARNLASGSFRPLISRFNHDPLAAFDLRRIAADFAPDLVLTQGNRATGIALLPFSGVAHRTVQVVHNFRHKPQVARLLAAIAVSDAVHDSLRPVHPALPVFTVDNFAPLDTRPVKAAPTGTIVLGTLGRLHVNKGLDIVLKAVAALRQDGVDVRLKIAGDGPLRENLTALVATLGLKDHVDFIGWVEGAGDYLGSLDLFVCSSRVEPFGLVVIEAMAAGAAVVASDIDGPRQILNGGAYGYLCRKEDPAAMAAAIRTALSDWDSTRAMARAGQAHVLARFSLDPGKARLHEAMQQIAHLAAKKA